MGKLKTDFFTKSKLTLIYHTQNNFSLLFSLFQFIYCVNNKNYHFDIKLLVAQFKSECISFALSKNFLGWKELEEEFLSESLNFSSSFPKNKNNKDRSYLIFDSQLCVTCCRHKIHMKISFHSEMFSIIIGSFEI